jgi:hypothetical protein
MKVFYASIYLRIDLLRTDLIKKRAIKTFRRFGNKKDIRKKRTNFIEPAGTRGTVAMV